MGGDYNFDMVNVIALSALQFQKDFVFYTFFDFQRIVSGNYPFYLQPYLNMRGVPLFYYQGDSAFSSELELRWDFYKRFSAVGFFGVGATASDGVNEGGDVVDTYGFGLRYLLSRPLKLRAGFDVAWGLFKTELLRRSRYLLDSKNNTLKDILIGNVY